MSKFLVLTDTSEEQYSIESTLFAITDTKEDAIKWIREHQKVKLPWKKKKFDFKKQCWTEKMWKDDEELFKYFVTEFKDGEPDILACYFE